VKEWSRNTIVRSHRDHVALELDVHGRHAVCQDGESLRPFSSRDCFIKSRSHTSWSYGVPSKELLHIWIKRNKSLRYIVHGTPPCIKSTSRAMHRSEHFWNLKRNFFLKKIRDECSGTRQCVTPNFYDILRFKNKTLQKIWWQGQYLKM